MSTLRIRYMLDGPGGYDERRINIPVPSREACILIGLGIITAVRGLVELRHWK